MMQSRTHNCGELRAQHAGEHVKLVGWMENVREVGQNFAFVVVRDFYGTTQVVIETEDMMKVVKALKGRHCVLVKDGGALCCGSNESNAGAVEMIAEKSCLTYIGSGLFGKCKPINPIESLLMRVIYLKKYSKQAE